MYIYHFTDGVRLIVWVGEYINGKDSFTLGN